MILDEMRDKYAIGNIFLDEQHYHFLTLIDNLQVTNGDILDSVIEELTAYINYHFETEEDLLESVNYPYLEEHKKKHLHFVGLVGKMVGDIHVGTIDVEQVKKCLTNWFLEHICIEDMKFKEYLDKDGQEVHTDTV